jgi:hypothetical protein
MIETTKMITFGASARSLFRHFMVFTLANFCQWGAFEKKFPPFVHSAIPREIVGGGTWYKPEKNLPGTIFSKIIATPLGFSKMLGK